MRFIYLAAALLLVACNNNTTTLTDDYLNRVARVLDVSNPNLSAIAVPAFPRQGELVVPIESVRIDVLDAWSLRSCGLLPFVGERNSILGQVMPASVALDYEMRLLKQLSSCLANEEVDQALITNIIEQKSKQLSARLWNATIAAEEFRQFWRLAQSPVGVDESLPTEGLSKVLTDWQRLVETPNPDTMSLAVFEQNNQQLYQMNRGMSWLRSTLEANAALKNGNHMLQQAIDQPLCPRGTLPTARNAQNVMVKFYVGNLQPHFAQLNRFGEVLVSQVQAVNELLAVNNPEFEQFFDLVTETHRDFHSLNQQHVALWQQLMNSCDLTVTNML